MPYTYLGVTRDAGTRKRPTTSTTFGRSFRPRTLPRTSALTASFLRLEPQQMPISEACMKQFQTSSL
ncbi:hypothetical protein [Aquipseudomonas alcaligenes]|uniref:hypothetical protein n=1 Tax=Aquipseudomonas alcaligenes TaxID=43263 RepID=UPI0011C0807B|nr:hypothetical protein [Pseudomonas alcaligenes]